MAGRVRDLWHTTGARGPKRKTSRHPDNGGNPDADRWLAVWMVDGAERSKAFHTKDAARVYSAQMQADVERGDYADPRAGKVSVGQLAARWLHLLETGASTRQRYESVYRLHIRPTFGDKAAGAVKPSDVAAWSKGLAGQPMTRQLALMVLSRVFDLAVADGVVRANPARSPIVVRPPQHAGLRREAWDAARIRAVAQACGPWEAAVLTAAALGLREGELFALAADDVDGEQVRVRRQTVRVHGGYYFKLPKGGKERTVPLPRGAAPLLAALEPVPATLSWLGEDGMPARRPATAALLFPWPGGSVIQPWHWDRKVWKPALVAAGVIPPYEGRNTAARQDGMHALRHWYTSCLLDAGVSLAGVQAFLGHSAKSAPLALGVYGHVTADTREAARQAVDRALFGLRPVAADGTVTELRRAR